MKKAIGLTLIAIGVALIVLGDEIADLTGLDALAKGASANLVVATVCIMLGFLRLRGR